jgi:hypothetical protein
MFSLESLDIKYIGVFSIICIIFLFVFYYYKKNHILLWTVVLFFLVFIQNILFYNNDEANNEEANNDEEAEPFANPLWDAWKNNYSEIDKKAYAIEKTLREIDTSTKPLQYYSKTNIVNK